MKKFFRIFIFFVIPFFSTVYSQEAIFAPDGWNFNLVTDIVEMPESNYVSGNTHFAPVTGAFYNFQMRERFHAVYLKHIPITSSPLFQYANISLDLGAELTPIDFGPMFSITFMPLPFFLCSAGGMFCAGWPIFGIDTISKLDPSTKEWDALTPFKNNYYELFASTTLQFDFGAIFPGEWSHIIISATYKVLYKAMTGMNYDDVWSWQGEPNMTNGLTYFQTFMIGYHFPKGINFLGLISNIYGYYDANAYGKQFTNYKADFTKIDINPLIEFKFKKETIDFLIDISSRRSFSESHTNMKDEVYLHCIGREWYLRSFIISWKHNF